MAPRVIYVKRRPYYYFDTYSTWDDALRVAKIYRNKAKSRYFILKHDQGFLFPTQMFALYLHNRMRLLG